MALIFVLLHITLVLSVGYILKRFLRNRRHAETSNYLNEMISTFEFSTCVFEVNAFGRVYGFNAALLATFCLLICKNYKVLFEGRTLNPCGQVEYFLKGYRKTCVLIMWLMQTLGACVSYLYISWIWKVSQNDYHLQQLEYRWNPRQTIGIIFGFMIEFLATFVCSFAEYATCKNGYEKINRTLSAATCIIVAYLFAETTDVWMNPAIATAHGFKLRTNLLENIFIFWLAPIVGAFLAYQCNNSATNR